MSFGDFITNILFKKVNKIDKDGNEEIVLAFRDNQGYLLSKNEGMGFKEKLIKNLEKIDEFYNIENVDEWINEYNLKISFSEHRFKYDEENGVYLLKEATYDKRKPKLKYKDLWSFTCQWCGKKWSTEENEYYYVAYFNAYDGRKSSSMVCSEECANNASIDAQKTWISANGYSKFFTK